MFEGMFGEDFFKHVDETHARRRREFEKLACEPCLKEIRVGCKVLLSAVVLGRGFEWDRIEAVVLGLADTAVKVRFKQKYDDKYLEEWVHRLAVTDVLEEE